MTPRHTLVAVAPLVLLAFAAATTSRPMMDLFVMVCLFGAMATAWNLMAGFTGLLSLGHSLFFGIGAYTVAVLQNHHAWTPAATWPLGLLLATALAAVIGILCFRYRLRGHHFAIFTLAASQLGFFIVSGLEWLGRSDGLMVRSLEPASLYLQFEGKWPYGLISAAILLVTLAVGERLLHTRPGFYWQAIRDNEDAADALGVPVTAYKLLVLVLSAAVAALCGAFYASYVAFVDPRSVLGVEVSVQLLVFSIIGGLHRVWGPLLGAALLLPLNEMLRAWLGSSFKGGSIVVYSLALIILALVMPGGLGSLVRKRRQQRAQAAASAQEAT